MIIYLGADHAGFELKEKIKTFLSQKEYEIEDMGNTELNPDDDYPDFIIPVAEAVAEDPENRRGIILGYSGQGEAIAANRFLGVRAVVYYGPPAQASGQEEIITLSREHNDANILSLGAGFVNEEEIMNKIEKWLKTPFSNEERHQRRIDKIK